MKRLYACFVCALLACPSWALADSQSGTITAWLAHSYTANRGPCVQLSPALPGTGWACLYRTSNDNYKELVAALLSARLTGTPISIWWDALDAENHKIIAQLQL